MFMKNFGFVMISFESIFTMTSLFYSILGQLALVTAREPDQQYPQQKCLMSYIVTGHTRLHHLDVCTFWVIHNDLFKFIFD